VVYTQDMGILDILFPKHCVGCRKSGGYICFTCFARISFDVDTMCTVCNKPSIDGRTHPICRGRYTLDGTFSAVKYKGIMQKVLYQLKYPPYLVDLVPTLGELCFESCIQNEVLAQVLPKNPFLIPIPLSRKRLRKRGYNQAELLAKELGKRFGLEVRMVLQRSKETTPQYGLKREERIENMKEAFEIQTKMHESATTRHDGVHHDRVAILVDDVLTTGSTMLEAAKILKKNGFKEVWGMALAKD